MKLKKKKKNFNYRNKRIGDSDGSHAHKNLKRWHELMGCRGLLGWEDFNVCDLYCVGLWMGFEIRNLEKVVSFMRLLTSRLQR